MKAHIITVYDSMNYGSFFQAKALEWEIGKYLDVDFIDVHHQSNSKTTLKKCLKYIGYGRFSSALTEYRKLKLFEKAKKQFSIIDIQAVQDKKSDIFWFGSDEIWNISRPKIKKSKEFFGVGVPDKYRISIAPSINRTTYEQISSLPYVKEELEKFFSISVRDEYSKEIIGRLVQNEINLVVDPTLLHRKERYKKVQVSTGYHDYILIYSYGDMFKPGVKEKILLFAESKNLRIISVGTYFDFCDINTVVSPEEFLGIIDGAQYVFTDTFHGFMFSIIYEKQFVVFPCDNTKVENTLSMLKLGNRLCKNGQEIGVITDELIDYQIVASHIDEYSSRTRLFIKNNIEEILEMQNDKV